MTRRHGYTLLELLITLSVMAAVAAVTIPAIQGPLDKSRLRSAARELQAVLARARSSAIREGREVEFLYEPDGGRYAVYRVETIDSYVADVMVADESDLNMTPVSDLPGGTLDGIQERSPNGEPDGKALLRAGVLPTGVRFADPRKTLTAESAEGTVAGQMSSDLSTLPASSQTGWSEGIRFRPNGRGPDTELRIRGSRDFVVDIRLRGLTGNAAYTSPFRIEAAERRFAEAGAGAEQ